VAKLILAGVLLGVGLFAGTYGLSIALSGLTHFRDETALAILVLLGGALYFALVFLLLGRSWFTGLLRDVTEAADTAQPAALEEFDPLADSAALPDTTPPQDG